MTTFVIHFHNLNIDEHWRQVVTMSQQRITLSRLFFIVFLGAKKNDDNDDNAEENDDDKVWKKNRLSCETIKRIIWKHN